MNKKAIISDFNDLTNNEFTLKMSKETRRILLRENVDVEIVGDLDLRGYVLEMGSANTLLFNGGSICNGTVRGNGTKMTGCVRVERLQGNFSTAIRSSFSSLTANWDKLEMLLMLSVKTMILDEDYKLSSPQKQIGIECSNIEHIKGENVSISVTSAYTGSPFTLIRAPKLKEMSGITFDGGGSSLEGFLAINTNTTTQDRITIEDVTVENIINDNPGSYTIGICIDSINSNCNITLRNIFMNNLWQKGNGVVGNPEGAVKGIYIRMDASTLVNVRIDCCRFSEIHCYYMESGVKTPEYEDADGIHIDSNLNPSFSGESNNTVEISNIQGENFGKRLVKTDCANISIRNVMGKNEFFDNLCLIGLEATGSWCKYAHVQNVHHEGSALNTVNDSFVVGIGMQYTVVDNIVSKVTINPNDYVNQDIPPYYPVKIQADNVTIRNLSMIGAQTVRLPEKKNIRFDNVSYDDSVGATSSYCPGILMPERGTSAVIDGLYVKALHKTHLIFCVYFTSGTNPSNLAIFNSEIDLNIANAQTPCFSIINGNDWELGNNKHLLNLTMKNCVCHHAENINRFPFLKKEGRWNLEHITLEYESLPTNLEERIGYFNSYTELENALTIKDVTVLSAPSTIPALIIVPPVPSGIAQVFIENIRAN